ncbi:hypothetical protein C8R44DRAFT_766592 [Mycena epipterygia]|nr:hypothetical protein C8R44DRAFT_766592 [Mycena epipterygia]
MSSGLHTHRQPQPQYVHYTGPAPPTTVSPQDTQHTPAPPPPKPAASARQQGNASTSGSGSGSGSTAPQPVVAKGNWTKDLVQLAKTAELKKHALTLQLHTAHILSAHASLEQKNRAIEDIREQRNKLESERNRLIACLSQVNEDRNQADLLTAALTRERTALQSKIATLSDGEYAAAKADVDRLRHELGQPALPSLQETLEGKGAGYLTERRMAGGAGNANNGNNGNGNGNGNQIVNQNVPQSMMVGAGTATAMAGGAGGGTEKKRKRAAGANTNGNGAAENGSGSAEGGGEERGQMKRPRGRPRGSRNRGAAPG